MPMTNVGKIYKPELREMAAALMADPPAAPTAGLPAS